MKKREYSLIIFVWVDITFYLKKLIKTLNHYFQKTNLRILKLIKKNFKLKRNFFYLKTKNILM